MSKREKKRVKNGARQTRKIKREIPRLLSNHTGLSQGLPRKGRSTENKERGEEFK